VHSDTVIAVGITVIALDASVALDLVIKVDESEDVLGCCASAIGLELQWSGVPRQNRYLNS